jgi:hypothetical protein
VTVRVTDNGGAFAQTRQQDYTIIVRPPTLLITKSSFAEGTVGVVNYNEALTAGGGIPPYTWSVVSGTLPDGLSLIGNTIRGTPTTAGSFIFSVRAADNGGAFAQTQQQAFTIVIKPPPLVITKASLAEGTVGVAYNETLTAGGGTPPFTWSVISGNLPGGLSLNGAAITGTPTTAGSFPVTIRVADNGGSAAQTQQQAYTIVIKPPPLLITKESLIEGTVGVFYSDTVIGGGGTPPFTWSVITGNLPPGLTLTGSIISGTPTTQGTFPVTIRVADAGGTMAQTNQKAFSIIIRPAPLVIATQSLPATVTNVPYSQTLTANGGTAPFTWSAENLPPGLTLTGATISGTPTVPGTSNITIRITDAGTPQQTAQKTLSLLIVSTLTVTTPSPLPVGSAGFVYSLNLTALGGVANYAWSIVDGTLPPGINFGAGGSLAGTPTVTGSFNFTVRVTDSGIPQQTTQKSFELIIGTPITVANPSGLPRGVSGSAYSHTLTATGGTPDYRWAVIDGRFPPGLTLAGGGVISGTPLIDGTFSFTVRVTDSASPERTATAVVEIVISSVLAITTPPALPVAVIGFAYSRQLQASLQGPLTWSVLSGSLPQGLNLSEAGNITGTPAATGSFSFTVQVAGGTPQQGATRVFQLEVRGGLTITTPVVLPEGSVPIPYSLPLGASGGTPPYTWSVTSGTLPNGLTLSNSGLLGGTPAQTGTFTFTIRVTDTSNGTDSREFSLLIPQTGLQITTASLSTGIQSFAYSQQLEASGGPAPLTWALLSGALPPGLVLTPAGVLQGLPTTTGSANIRVGVSDSRGASDARDFVLAVGPAVPSLLLTGAPSAADPAQQLPLVLSLSQAYPLPLSGTLTISVTPGSAVPADDPALQFSSGGRTVNFTFPANSTTAEFSSPLFLLTGTVAGTIATSGSVRNGPPASVLASTSVRSTAPQITSVVVSRVSGGLRVQAIGFSSERRVTDAQFGFDVRSANGMERVNLTKVVEPEFSSWYQSSTSTPFGSTFLFEQMFAIQGDSNAVEGVTLTLANGQGSTTSARIPIP